MIINKKITTFICCLMFAYTFIAQGRTHTVSRGETLESIAKKYEVTLQSIVELNPTVETMFFVGMKLNIPESNTKTKSTTKHPTAKVTEKFPQSEPDQVAQTTISNIKHPEPSPDINFALAIQGGIGSSNFHWSNGKVNKTLAYSLDVLGQLYFRDRASFIPKNWYSEIALGYNKLGAADFNMNYIHLGIIPLGYGVPYHLLNIVLKAGVNFSIPLNRLRTYNNSWFPDFQVGIIGGLQIERKQFAIGCNVIYDFTEVSSSCNQTLNNIGVLGTLSYKFGKFGHKK